MTAVDHPEDLEENLALGLGLLEAQLRDAALSNPRARWLARRGLGIGCSELPAIWLALGLASVDEVALARVYIAEQSQSILGAKAHKGRMPRVSNDARLGRKRETTLFKRWVARMAAGTRSHEIERAVDHRTVMHVEGHPALQRLLPLVDRHERRLTDSTDAVAMMTDGRFAVVQGKCTVDPIEALPWYWNLQVQGEIAVTDADLGIVVCGEGWARNDALFDDGAFRVWPVVRDQALIERIRWAVRTSWVRIERYRHMAAERVVSETA